MTTNKNTAFLFPGQGGQVPGMGIELAKCTSLGDEIFCCGSDILGFDLKTLCASASAEELAQTTNAQPAIFTVSLLAMQALTERGVVPTAVAGHSLGEYAAMVCANLISMEEGYRLVKARAGAMQACAKATPSGMCAVIGLSANEIETICSSIDGYVVAVNYNTPTQTVVAGESDSLSILERILTEKKVKCIRLAVSAAFHSKLMQPAADAFYASMSGIPFHPPTVAFYSNVTGGLLDDSTFEDMPSYLAKHLVSPVRFVEQVTAMHENGANLFVELGAGKALSGMVKKIIKEASRSSSATVVSIQDQSSLLAFMEASR